MSRAIEWFARNPVAANLLMIVILAGGFLSIPRIKEEVFPEFSMDRITVTVPYLGAAPEEVEEGVCSRIEEEVWGLDGVKRVTSRAAEGLGTVTVELETGADVRRVLDDVKTRVDAISTFPEHTEKPIIQEVTNRWEVINVAVWGEADEKSLKNLAEGVRDDLASLPGVTQVELSNSRPYEVSIEVSEDALRRYGITFDFVAAAVRRSSLDMPGGSVKTRGGEILLRTKGQAYRGREFEDLVLLTRQDGTHLLLGDVASVRDGFAETDQFTRFDGKPAQIVRVLRTGDQSAIDIARKVKEYVAGASLRMPEGVGLTTWRDTSKVLRDRLDLLVRNGLNGFILVFILLTLFLRFRLAFWVSLGIPVAFLGALWLMPGLDVSINLISLFAFVVVLGIVVDDAIVVGENVYRHQHRLGKGLQGAIEGAREVMVPVVFAVLTTVAAFFPLLNVSGIMGKIMRVIPLVVIPCLLFSLVESMLVLPSHLSHFRESGSERKQGPWGRFQGMFACGLDWWVRRVYAPSLAFALRWRYLTVTAGAATLILTLGMFLGGWVRFLYFPAVEADYMSAALTMPQGTPVEETSAALRRLEASLDIVRKEVVKGTGEDVFQYVNTGIGSQPYREAQTRGMSDTGESFSGSHLGEVTVELVPAERRRVSSTDLAARWRELTGTIPDAVELDFNASIMHTGKAIDVQLTGPDMRDLRAAANELKERLRTYSGVFEIADTFREGKKEVKLRIKPKAELLGLTQGDLGRQVRQAFYGEEAQRIQRGRDDIKVMVRYPEGERRSLGDLENMRIRTPAGVEVPFGEVAGVAYGRGYAAIRRVDRRRAVSVTADVDSTVATPGDIRKDLEGRVLPALLERHPRIRYSFEGQQADQRDSMRGLQRGFAIALILIYALLAIPLKSYLQPIVIMLAIPFGLVGAIWGHMIMGLDLSILSLFGIVALSGVVVNDSLVMVDFINRHRRETGKLRESVERSGTVRFRPILLTSLTTFAGLTPLLLERSMQARFLVPMAVSLAFGVMFSTVISLMLVPAGYLILEDLRGAARRIFGRRPAGRDASDAAGVGAPDAAAAPMSRT